MKKLEPKYSTRPASYCNSPLALSIPIIPTRIQNRFNTVYALSFLRIAHQESRIASSVLKIQTNRNGLSGPSQLTSVKLIILMITPIISKVLMCFKITSFIMQYWQGFAGIGF